MLKLQQECLCCFDRRLSSAVLRMYGLGPCYALSLLTYGAVTHVASAQLIDQPSTAEAPGLWAELRMSRAGNKVFM